MTILIKGRYSKDNVNMTTCEWTAEGITALLKDGHVGMIKFQNVFGTYEIDGINYSANALSIGDESLVYEIDGKIVVPTYFTRNFLANQQGLDPCERVKVNVVFDTEKHPLEVTIVKIQN